MDRNLNCEYTDIRKTSRGRKPRISGALPVLLLVFLGLAIAPGLLASAAAAGSAGSGSGKIASVQTWQKNRLVRINGDYYFYGSQGRLLKNSWKTINGERYYFTRDGSAALGPYTVSQKQYFFSGKGILQKSGLRTWQGHTYYVNAQGVLSTGWKKISGKEYYFDPSDGHMWKNQWVGERYVGADGAYNAAKKPELAKLKSQLRRKINSYSGTWSVYVKNLKTNESFSINNRSMYAASLIKLYAMAGTYEKIRQGKLSESSVSTRLTNMITVSDNWSFNDLVRKIGTSYINTWCKENGYSQTRQYHGLEPSGNSAGLRTGGGSNVTSVEDCGKFLESVYRGTCVSASCSAKMLKLLKRQQRRWKIPAGVPAGVTVANKTGETNNYTHDAAIVYSPGATYIICVMACCPGYAWSAASRIPALSRTVYQYFN